MVMDCTPKAGGAGSLVNKMAGNHMMQWGLETGNGGWIEMAALRWVSMLAFMEVHMWNHSMLHNGFFMGLPN
ncbi:hypothetical protein PTKIN_Ptkin17bG0134900 [Pterospermum kingtungense]